MQFNFSNDQDSRVFFVSEARLLREAGLLFFKVTHYLKPCSRCGRRSYKLSKDIELATMPLILSTGGGVWNQRRQMTLPHRNVCVDSHIGAGYDYGR